LTQLTSEIRFFQVAGRFPKRNLLRQCLSETAAGFGIQKIRLHYVFLDDDELLAYNQQFLEHDFYTDILTFDLSDPETDILEGEIYISRDRVVENSGVFKSSRETEYCRVIAHGLLHLCGLDDHNEKDRKKMEAAENAFISRYFELQNPKG
jgi:probable rRNA maturation factor